MHSAIYFSFKATNLTKLAFSVSNNEKLSFKFIILTGLNLKG